MPHFAKIENEIVTQVIVADEEFINSGAVGSSKEWIQTSYNTHGNQHPENRPLRGNYAGIGYKYDRQNDVFYAPKPYDSWVLNKNTWLWEAPVPMPNSSNCQWDESVLNWVEIIPEPAEE